MKGERAMAILVDLHKIEISKTQNIWDNQRLLMCPELWDAELPGLDWSHSRQLKSKGLIDQMYLQITFKWQKSFECFFKAAQHVIKLSLWLPKDRKIDSCFSGQSLDLWMKKTLVF